MAPLGFTAQRTASHSSGSGSGTTAVAAMNTHRRFICFENAPSIYTIAAQRIEQVRLAMAGGEKGE